MNGVSVWEWCVGCDCSKYLVHSELMLFKRGSMKVVLA